MMEPGSEYVAVDVPDQARLADQLARSEANQKTLNALLRLSLEDLELEDLLRRALTLVLDNPWPATLGVGVVFLVDHDSNELVLKAHNGISAPLLERCARVPFGTCLCGRVAATREPLHTAALCDVHEVSYPNMLGHGHYCIPIAAGGTLLGVLNVYVREGHPYDASEEAFLGAFTSTLAGMVVRKRAEDPDAVEHRQDKCTVAVIEHDRHVARDLICHGQIRRAIAIQISGDNGSRTQPSKITDGRGKVPGPLLMNTETSLEFVFAATKSVSASALRAAAKTDTVCVPAP